MEIKYGQEVDNEVIKNNLTRITNQIFSLLPKREEDDDWIKPLQTLIIELSGMFSLLPDQEELFRLVCKLEGLLNAGEDVDFMLFRRHIFEACSIVSKIKDNVF